MKKKRFIIISGIFLLLTFAAGFSSLQAGPTDGVTGCWRTVDDKTGKINSKICLWRNSRGRLYGTIKRLYNPKEKNPRCSRCKGRRYNRPILGMTILVNMKKGSDAWEGGYLLDPQNGKWYRCKLWRSGRKLKVRGYIAYFYRSQTWIK